MNSERSAPTPNPTNWSQRPALAEPGGSVVEHASRASLLFVSGLVATILTGWFSLLGPVKEVDEAVFSASVGALQAIPGWTDTSAWLTDLGAVQLNYSMALVAAVALGLLRRSLVIPVVLVAVFMFSHRFQWLTNEIVDGTVPVDDRIVGSAGPYFSGGVQRVVLLTGMALSALQPVFGWRDRTVWIGATVLGLIEAVTRLTLGRHWPFDLVAAFPIGFGFIWAFRCSVVILSRFVPEGLTSR